MNRFVRCALILAALLFWWGNTAHAWGESHGEEPPVRIYINLWSNTLTLLENGQPVKTYPIAPGAPNTPTPIGDFRIIHKSANWGGGFGTRWMRLDVPHGIYGIHGTNKPHLIGQYVSNGCIRMRNADIEELYPQVQLFDRVLIDGPILGEEGIQYRVLVTGSRGSLVRMVQNRLRAGGYYHGPVNGVFDLDTEQALKQYQGDSGLPITGQVHFEDLVQLGVVE